jgi:hypothetical protein
MLRGWLVRLAGALVLVVAVGPWSSVVHAASSCILKEIPSPGEGKDLLVSLDALGTGVVAGGTSYFGIARTPLVARNNGGSWIRTTIDNVEAFVSGVAARGDGTAWAVGTSIGQIPRARPVALFWDGRTWSTSPVADPGSGEDDFISVDTEPDGTPWVVGRTQIGPGFRPLVERWGNDVWSEVPAPDPGSDSTLASVAVAGAHDIWATGWVLHGRRFVPLAEHWNGARWTIVATPSAQSGDTILSAVSAASPTDVWAAGWNSSAGTITPGVQHWDGHAWSPVDTGLDLGSAQFQGVRATSDRVVLVGRRFDATGHGFPLVVQRTGGAWGMGTVQGTDPRGGVLRSVAIDRFGHLWAVGNKLVENGSLDGLTVTGC